MKRIIYILSLFLLSYSSEAQLNAPPSGDNQRSIITQYIGAIVNVTVDYNSPDVTGPSGEDRRGKIWGQLVPYGFQQQGFGLNTPAAWRAGANENTRITFSHDVLVQGQPIAAGTYGLSIAVAEEGPWTIIFNKKSDAWGSYYYEEDLDALRVEATPEEHPYTEWLSYSFVDRQKDEATCALLWEDISLPFTVKVPNPHEIYMSDFVKTLEGTPNGFGWQAWNQAAAYCLQNNHELEQGLAWAEQSISAPFIGQANFTTLSTKSGILRKMGKTNEADKIMDEAISHPTASVFQIHAYGRQLIAQGEAQKALKIFQKNVKLNGNIWPVNVGLARGYSAVGDYKKALKYAQLALKRAPDPLNEGSLKQAIEKLKKNEDIN